MDQLTFDEEMKQRFGGKVYRLSLSSGCTCPNRDGFLGTGGCIFCSAGGSGEFAAGIVQNKKIPVKAAGNEAAKAEENGAEAVACSCPEIETNSPPDGESEIKTRPGFGFAVNAGCGADPGELRKAEFPESSETARKIDAAIESLDAQIEEAKQKVSAKLSRNFAGYMAYFQSFTNTYGPVDKLERLFSAALEREDILALSVATRPDCLPQEIIDMLAGLNRKKPVWVELGLQTMHEDTAKLIRRGYELPVFEDAVKRLKAAGLQVVVHVIIGLPGEDRERVRETVRYLGGLRGNSLSVKDPEFSGEPDRPMIDGIKLQILQVLKGTVLAEMKRQDPEILPEYSLEEYALFLKELLEILPPEITVHRLTGDPPKSLLISPLWTADKKKVLNTIRRVLFE